MIPYRCSGRDGGDGGSARVLRHDERLRWLSAAGDPLERLAAVVDFELFRPELDAALGRSDRAKGGRPPYDAVLMFKRLVLQSLYKLSDDQAEYQIRDRLSFMRFSGFRWRRGPRRQDDLAVPRAAGPRRAPSSGCSPASTRRWRSGAIWPWAGRSSTPPSWRRGGRA